VTCLERGVELTHAVQLLGDLLSVDGLVGAADQRCKRTIVAVGIDPVDALVLDSADARAEAQAQHGEGGEVDLGKGDLVGKTKPVMGAPALAELHEIFLGQSGSALELFAGKHCQYDTATRNCTL